MPEEWIVLLLEAATGGNANLLEGGNVNVLLGKLVVVDCRSPGIIYFLEVFRQAVAHCSDVPAVTAGNLETSFFW